MLLVATPSKPAPAGVDALPRSIVLTCGGTGGHVYPAIAIAEELASRVPAAALSFVGRPDSYESRTLERAGFELDGIEVGRFAGQSVARRLRTLAALPGAVRRGRGILRRRGAELVIGTGGFVSGPVMLAAVRSGLPTLIQEQNAVPGLTNRVLRRFVDRVALAHADVRCTGARFRVTGNPVRADLLAVRDWSPPGAGEPLDVLVLGGSQGARSLNRAAIDAVAPGGPLEPLAGRVRLTIQCGVRWEEEVRAGVTGSVVDPEVAPYLHDVPARLARAHLVIARSGASTIAELCAAGRPSVLVPFPHAAADHQSANARVLEEAGAARVVADADFGGEELASAVRQALEGLDDLRRRAVAARSLARPDAAGAIVDLALEAFRHHRPRGGAA